MNKIFNSIEDMEVGKIYSFNEKNGRIVYAIRTHPSAITDKVLHWFEGEPEEEKALISFETLHNLMKSKRIVLKT